MSLINKASLILTPNSVKEGKIHSIIPSNGNGDMSFVRATTATRVNELGLIEDSPYNLLKYSEDFSNASWSKQEVLVLPNDTIAPNGTLTADKIIPTLIASTHQINQLNLIAFQECTVTFFAKAAGYNTVTCLDSGNGSNFNLTTGVVSNIGVSVGSMIAKNNGWWECKVIYNVSGIRFYIPSTSSSFVGDGTSGIYIWGAQLVTGSAAKPYFPTTDRLNVPRLNYDVAGGCPTILLEPQRTNLVLQSQDFSNNLVWAKTASQIGVLTTSPTGALNAVSYISNNTTNVYIGQSQNFLSGNSYNISVFAKKNATNYISLTFTSVCFGANDFTIFNLQNGTVSSQNGNVFNSKIEAYQDGWYKCSVSCICLLTTTGSTPLITPSFLGAGRLQSQIGNSIYIFGAQMEIGSYSTSYIPTLASAVTRNLDYISRNNIYTNGLITSAGGTWFVELNNNIPLVRDSGGNLYIGDNISSGTLGNSLTIRNNGGSQRLSINKTVGGGLTSLYVITTDTVKIAIKWNGITADFFVNGTKVVASTPFNATNMEYLIGGGSDVPKYIKSMLLFPTPLSDSELIQLTTL